MEIPKEKDFNSNCQSFKVESFNIEACPTVANPRAFIKELVKKITEHEKKLKNPPPEFSSFGDEPIHQSDLLKYIKGAGIEKTFVTQINTFDCTNEELIDVAKKLKSIKFFYTWIEAFMIAEKVILGNILNGNNRLGMEGINHLEVYFKIEDIEFKIDLERYSKDADPEYIGMLNFGIEPAFWGMVHNSNTIAFSKIPNVKI